MKLADKKHRVTELEEDIIVLELVISEYKQPEAIYALLKLKKLLTRTLRKLLRSM